MVLALAKSPRPKDDNDLGNLSNRFSGRFETPALETIKASDLRHLNKIARLDNEASYILELGPLSTLSAYGTTVQVRSTKSEAKIPGTELRSPPIHFMTEGEFFRLEEAVGRITFLETSAGEGASVTTAWFDAAVGVRGAIEIPVSGFEGETLAPQIMLSGSKIKHLTCLIAHELEHAAGRGEFAAFRKQHDLEFQFGLSPNLESNLEIMKYIESFYDHNEIADAAKEFSAHCKEHSCPEDERQYWAWVEACEEKDNERWAAQQEHDDLRDFEQD